MGFLFPAALASFSTFPLMNSLSLILPIHDFTYISQQFSVGIIILIFNQSNKRRKLKQFCSRKLDAPNLKKVVVENEAISVDLKNFAIMAILEIVNSIVGTIVGKCVNPILRQFQYLIFYKSSFQTLSDDVRKLEQKETEVQQAVDRAKDNAEEIKPTVIGWLERVKDWNELRM
nr:uncharacterized protein LOC113735970 [Coffea arabica]